MLTLVTKLAHPHALYKCACGALHVARTSMVRCGKTKSCGCLRGKSVTSRNTTHEKSGTPIYAVWNSMMSRCHNPSSQAYKNYGARGISVSHKWHKFDQFYADMGEPGPGLTLDREDNELGYSKENCRWVSQKAQNNNKRNNVRLTFRGETRNVTQWAEELNIPRQLIYDRLRIGWTHEQALSRPRRGAPHIKNDALNGG